MNTFEELVADSKNAVARVGEGFTTPDEDWTPVILAHTPDRLVIVGLFVDKDKWPAVAKAVVRKEGAIFLAGVLSSWTVSTGDIDEVMRWYEQGKSLSEHPDRQEILLLDCANRTRHESWKAEIIRHPDKPPTLGEWELMAGTVGGALGDMLTAAFNQPDVASGPH